MLWKLLAGAVVIALVGLFLWRFGDAKFTAGELAERVKWKDAVIENQKALEKLELSNADNKVKAVENYADRLAAFQPIVLHSKETVTHYAETPAGNALCLGTDRVLGIEQDRATIFPTYKFSTEQSPGTVSADSNTSQ